MSQRIALVLILLAALALRVTYIVVSSPADDAYITFRYAEHLASGEGFVYNAGERVLGTTTPLFTLLLVPLVAAGLPPDITALVLSVLCDLAICTLLFWMFRRGLGDAGGLAVAAMYGLFYASAAACGYGMETQFFELLVVTALAFTMSRRYEAAATLAGLAAVTRPEGFLLAAIVAAAVLSGGGRARCGRACAGFIAVAAPWYLFAWLYFGSPIPNSVHAKLFQPGIGLGQWADFFVSRNPIMPLLWLAAAVGAVLGARARDGASALFAAWTVLYAAFFLVARPPFLGGWYFPPLILSMTALAAVALVRVGQRVLGTRVRGAAVTIMLAAALCATVLPRSLASNRWSRTVARSVYLPLAEWIRNNTAPGIVVHAADIGYVGYFSRRRILDASALVTPEVRHYYAQHGADPNWDIALVLEWLPEVVVLPIRRDIYRRFEESRFRSHYQPAARFQVDGLTDLHPPLDTAEGYAGQARFMADYLVYTLTQRVIDGSAGLSGHDAPGESP